MIHRQLPISNMMTFGSLGISSCYKGSARWGAYWIHVKILHLDTLPGKSVQIGRVNQNVLVKPDIVPTLVIGQDKDNIGF